LPIPEPYLKAISQEDEDILPSLFLDIIGILFCLFFADYWISAGPFSLNYGKWRTIAIKKEVIDILAFLLVFQGLVNGFIFMCYKIGLFSIDFRDDLGAI
jgi:hypothetical protein